MPKYIEYQLDANTTILVESSENYQDKLVKASPKSGEITTAKAKKNFIDALKDIRVQAKLLIQEIEELHVSEAEIKFGVNTVGELGNLAIGKIGVGVNYEITLKWRGPDAKDDRT